VICPLRPEAPWAVGGRSGASGGGGDGSLRHMSPALVSRFIALFMGTSLVYIIGVLAFAIWLHLPARGDRCKCCGVRLRGTDHSLD